MAQRDGLGGGRPEAAAAPSPAGSQSQEKPAVEPVKELAQQAKEGTAELAGRARSQVSDLVAKGRHQTAQSLQSLASALSDVAWRLEEEDTAGFGDLARRAGEQAKRAARYFKEKDLADLVRDTETFARRHPDLFLGGSLVAGALLGRFLKSSAARRGNGHGGDGGYRRGERGGRVYEPYRAPSFPARGGL